jgi:hypothetical protein
MTGLLQRWAMNRAAPRDMPIVNWPNGRPRDPAVTTLVVKQFAPDLADPGSRYAKDIHGTYCNIFVWDVTRALGCEVPHWVNKRETTANDLADWLADLSNGWNETDDPEKLARGGLPIVAVWKNPQGHGHIAIGYMDGGGFAIAQAGGKNFESGTVAEGFGKRDVKFYYHA